MYYTFCNNSCNYAVSNASCMYIDVKLIFHDVKQACVSKTTCNFLIDLWNCLFDRLDDKYLSVNAPYLFYNVAEMEIVSNA